MNASEVRKWGIFSISFIFSIYEFGCKICTRRENEKKVIIFIYEKWKVIPLNRDHHQKKEKLPGHFFVERKEKKKENPVYKKNSKKETDNRILKRKIWFKW